MIVESTADGLIVRVDSEAETVALGRALAGLLVPGVVVGLDGPLGAGKTRLVRAIAEAAGVDPAAISSPTFGLIHEYEGDIPIYHLDLYRLKSPADLDAIGGDEYFDGLGTCLVEWADKAGDRLPADAWRVAIEPGDGESRRFHLRVPPGAAPGLATAIGGD